MNVTSTDVVRKCNTVVTRLQQLLRFVVITGVGMLAIFALYLTAGQPITSSSTGVVFFMLVALTATSIFIAFYFDFWFIGPLLNAGALFSTPILLGRDLNAWFVAAVIVGSLLFLIAAMAHTARRQDMWELDEADTSYDQRLQLFAMDRLPLNERSFRFIQPNRAERLVIEYPAHASIFELMNAAKKAWTINEVRRLELEIVRRGAWDLYCQLEGSEYRQTAVGPPDTMPPRLKWAESHIETWLELRFKHRGRLKRFLAVARPVLGVLTFISFLLSGALLLTLSPYLVAPEPAPRPTLMACYLTFAWSLLNPLLYVIVARIQKRRAVGVSLSRH